MVDGGAPEQLRQALANATRVLAEAGATLEQVVKTTLFLVDMGDFAACNEVWVEVFDAPRPTRSAVAVAQLPLGARAEVEMWAYSPLN
jgi:2-iminobutanoate/2-iminopropanoate deaminase